MKTAYQVLNCFVNNVGSNLNYLAEWSILVAGATLKYDESDDMFH